MDAFVAETISGKLTITTEKAVNPTGGKPTDKSIKLTEAERYVIEAGSFLAYKPADSAAVVGNQIVAMVPDPDNLEAKAAALGAQNDEANASGSAWAKLNYAKAQLGNSDDASTKDTAYGKLKKAQEALVAVESSAREAFVALAGAKIAEHNASNPTDTYPTNVDNLTYTQLTSLGIVNTDDGYTYYEKYLAVKKAEADLAKAQNGVAVAENAKEIAQNEYNEAEAAVGTPSDTDAKDTAYGRLAKATADVNSAQTTVNTKTTELGADTDEASNAEGATAYAKLNYAQNALGANTDEASNISFLLNMNCKLMLLQNLSRQQQLLTRFVHLEEKNSNSIS